MEEEYTALLANQTWDLVPHPPGSNIVTGKWIWTHKRRANGTLERYKARWVLRGFTHRPGGDYDELQPGREAGHRPHGALAGSHARVARASAERQECLPTWRSYLDSLLQSASGVC